MIRCSFKLALLTMLMQPSSGFSVCASLIKGDAAININSCGLLSPEKSFPTSQFRYQFIGNLGAGDRASFYNSYRGLLVEGLVVRSMAIQSGLSPKKGALNGETVTAFIPPGVANCHQIRGKRIKTLIDEACCEGGGDPPCLLDTTYVLKNIKVLGEASSSAGNVKRQKMEMTPQYQKANRLLQQGKFDQAAALYQQLRSKNLLDMRGHYFLGYAARMMDRCDQAIPVLERVFKSSIKNDFWADDKSVVKKSNMLLARCYAKRGNVNSAMTILNSLLLAPAQNRPEIREALQHPDFGRLRTSKAYQDFRQQTQSALKR